MFFTSLLIFFFFSPILDLLVKLFSYSATILHLLCTVLRTRSIFMPTPEYVCLPAYQYHSIVLTSPLFISIHPSIHFLVFPDPLHFEHN